MNKTASMLFASILLTSLASANALAQDDPAKTQAEQEYQNQTPPPDSPPPVDETDQTAPPTTSNDAADIANEMQAPMPPAAPVAPMPPTPPAPPAAPPAMSTAPAAATSTAGATTAVLPQASSMVGANVVVTSKPGDSISSSYHVDFAALDKNNDGMLSRSEVTASGNADLMREFVAVDINHNGRLSRDEMKGWTN